MTTPSRGETQKHRGEDPRYQQGMEGSNRLFICT